MKSEIYIGRVNRKRRAGRYIRRERKVTPVERRLAEERSFQGETVMGVQVSTFPQSWCFGVIRKDARGKKLLSKHETSEDAMDASGPKGTL